MLTQWNLEQNIRKQIDCKRPSNTKQMNGVQNIRIETCILLVVCVMLALNYIKQARCNQ